MKGFEKMKKLQKTSAILLLVALLLGGIKVNAADTTTPEASFKFNVTASTSELKAGEEVTLTLGISNINVGETGINTLQGKLTYDENIFEKVTSSSIASQNNWTITYNDEATEKKGTFLAVILSDGVKENQTIGTIKLKVKENVTAGSTQIKFTEVSSSDGTTIVKETDKTISLTIKGEEIIEPTTNTTTNTTNTTNGTIIGNKTNNINTSANKNLPKTGSVDTYLVVAATILVLAGIVAFINYQKNNTDQ